MHEGVCGEGRIGTSISKKVLRRAVARNRVRRLVREVFRENREALSGKDLHIVGRMALKANWAALTKESVRIEFERFFRSLSPSDGFNKEV